MDSKHYAGSPSELLGFQDQAAKYVADAALVKSRGQGVVDKIIFLFPNGTGKTSPLFQLGSENSPEYIEYMDVVVTRANELLLKKGRTESVTLSDVIGMLQFRTASVGGIGL